MAEKTHARVYVGIHIEGHVDVPVDDLTGITNLQIMAAIADVIPKGFAVSNTPHSLDVHDIVEVLV